MNKICSFSFITDEYFRLDRRLPVDSVSAPICLPGGNRFPDQLRNATVVGMGFKWEPDKTCSTVSGGPDPFHPCRLPFIYAERGREEKFYRCARTQKTPSSFHKMCRDLHKQMGRLRLPSRYSALVTKQDGAKVDCYDLSPHDGGWCPTCDTAAIEGDELYCGNHTVAFKTLKDHWGWCDSDCSHRGANPIPKALLRTTVRILDEKQCVSTVYDFYEQFSHNPS